MQGKELAVVMAGADERQLIDWLRGTTTIQILALNARHESSVWLDDLPPASGNGLNTRFALWNRAFDWTPEVQVRDHDAGVCNARTAPVIEYRRAGGSAGIEGRLYWPRGMCADGPFEHAHRRYAYDVVAFERWWRQIEAWVKSHAQAQQRAGAPPLFVFPGAAQKTGNPLARVVNWFRAS